MSLSLINFFSFICYLLPSFFLFLDCGPQGWSVLVYAAQAEIGYWKEAWRNLNKLKSSVYLEAGGNGHSRSNSLWYISTRPDYTPTLSRSFAPSPTPAI